MRICIELDTKNHQDAQILAFISEKSIENFEVKNSEILTHPPNEQKKEAPKNKNQNSVTLESIKNKVSSVVTPENRETIKKWLTDNGAKSVTTLPVEKYEDFYAYLENI